MNAPAAPQQTSTDASIIDSHVHAFPGFLGSPALREDLYEKLFAKGPLGEMRKHLRSWWAPVAGSMHYTQTLLRYLPDSIRKNLDEVSALAPIAGLVFESSLQDLVESLEKNNVSQALLIAHPPFVTNEFVLECCQAHPHLHPVVNIPRNTKRISAAVKHFVQAGAKALKIHPAVDAEGAGSPRYKSLLKAAASLNLPVIIHSGSGNSHLIYRDPNESRAERFKPWFKAWPETPFILAHMNYHEPRIAMDLAEEFQNVHLESSWQPSEIIGEAVRRLGDTKVLYGSDWPFVGNNISIALGRIENALETGLITWDQHRNITHDNAARIFKLKEPHPATIEPEKSPG